jgi:hypothetical protein
MQQPASMTMIAVIMTMAAAGMTTGMGEVVAVIK